MFLCQAPLPVTSLAVRAGPAAANQCVDSSLSVSCRPIMHLGPAAAVPRCPGAEGGRGVGAEGEGLAPPSGCGGGASAAAQHAPGRRSRHKRSTAAGKGEMTIERGLVEGTL